MQSTTPSTTTLASGLNGHEKRALMHIFQHPISHNLTMREVIVLFTSIGSAAPQHDGDVMLRVASERLSIRRPPNKDIDADDVMALRHMLTKAGWSPDREVVGVAADPTSMSETTPNVPGGIALP